MWKHTLWVLAMVGCHPTIPLDSLGSYSQFADTPCASALPLRAQADITIRAPKVQLTANSEAVLLLDTHHRFHFALLSPLRTPLAQIQSDGGGLSVRISAEKLHLFTPDANALLKEKTAGILKISDVFDLLSGQIPLERYGPIRARELKPNQWKLVWNTTKRTRVSGILAGNGLKQLTIRHPLGPILLRIRYDMGASPTSGCFLPDSMELDIPPLRAQADIRFGHWQQVTTPLPESAFSIETPPGFTQIPLTSSPKK